LARGTARRHPDRRPLIALSGPWAVGILADQGADVVKVEPPGSATSGAGSGPAIGGVSAMAQIANRGKRSIAVNLQTEAGRDVAPASRAAPTCSCRTSGPA
jgi:crotonobetainyl-CoA:carnitine CoA-transferase CaiB-like acyl-CoA transferase